MLRGIVVSLLCLLALLSAAQYNVKKMMEEGRRTLDQGHYVTPMQIFSRIIALKPDLYEAWYLMALSKYHPEDYKGAGDGCRRALTLQPYIADIYEFYGISNIHVKCYDSVIVAFTHALDITPDNRDYWFNHTYCLYQVGDNKAALQQLDYIPKRWKPLDVASRLRADIVAGRKPKQQPMKSNIPYFYKLPSLRIESESKSNPMKNKPLFSL